MHSFDLHSFDFHEALYLIVLEIMIPGRGVQALGWAKFGFI